MKTEIRVAVIGGGVVGASVLYHLTKLGWTDIALFEKHELTSGSTWHAAGLLPLFNLSYSVGQIHKYSVALYEKLEAETGQNVGFRKVSNIRLARTKDRWDEYMYYAGVARTIGVEVNVLTPDQVKAIWPLCETDGLICAIQHPDDGYIQPADLTQAFASRSPAARITGLDFTPEMLDIAQRKQQRLSAEVASRIEYLQGDAQALPLDSASVDVVSIAFGIRNVADPGVAIAGEYDGISGARRTPAEAGKSRAGDGAVEAIEPAVFGGV